MHLFNRSHQKNQLCNRKGQGQRRKSTGQPMPSHHLPEFDGNTCDLWRLFQNHHHMEKVNGILVPSSPSRHDPKIMLGTNSQLWQFREPNNSIATQHNKPQNCPDVNIPRTIQDHDRLHDTVAIPPYRQSEWLNAPKPVRYTTTNRGFKKVIPTLRNQLKPLWWAMSRQPHLAWADFKISTVHFDQWNLLISKM